MSATTPATSLTDLLNAVAREFPESDALIERFDGHTRTLTYRQLRTASSAVAARLAEYGVKRGEAVGVWLPNWLETVVIEFALAELGAANLGINTRYGTHELMHLLRTARPVGLIMPAHFHNLDFTGRLRDARVGLKPSESGLRWTAEIAWQNGGDVDVESWSFDNAKADRAGTVSCASGDDLVNFFTTSGSTGYPKLAGHSQSAVVTHAHNDAAALGLRAGDVVLGVLPFSGVFGFNSMLAALSRGAACLLEPVFDAAQVLRDMAECGVTHVVGGDDMFGRLMDEWFVERVELNRFRRGAIADFAGRSADVVRWADHHLGVEISGVYGSSEVFALAAVSPTGAPCGQRCIGGGRLVSPDIEVRVIDPETSRTLEVGQIGELQFRGYNVLNAYLANDEASANAFTHDGWFRSGDLGSLRETNGEFTYLCRLGDALRLHGFLVEPAEIEKFLMTHAAVDVAKVVGARDSAGAQTTVAFVTLRPGNTAGSDELVDYCQRSLARYKIPAAIHVIDRFPTTTGTNGVKIRTDELRRLAETGQGTLP